MEVTLRWIVYAVMVTALVILHDRGIQIFPKRLSEKLFAIVIWVMLPFFGEFAPLSGYMIFLMMACSTFTQVAARNNPSPKTTHFWPKSIIEWLVLACVPIFLAACFFGELDRMVGGMKTLLPYWAWAVIITISLPIASISRAFEKRFNFCLIYTFGGVAIALAIGYIWHQMV